MNESQDALRESTNGNFKQFCHCLLQLIKIPIKFRGCDSNIFPLIYVLDKDCDWQVTEAGVIRRQIQKPERSSEEVSKPTFYFFKKLFVLTGSWPAWCLQLWPPMCPLPGNVPDWLGLHWGGNTQLHWRQPCQLLQDENGTEHVTLTLCCCVRCFSHACDSSIYSSWVDTFDFYVIFCHFLQISHIIREIRQFQQTAYKIDYQPKVKLLFIFIVLQLSISCLDLSSIALWGVLKKF